MELEDFFGYLGPTTLIAFTDAVTVIRLVPVAIPFRKKAFMIRVLANARIRQGPSGLTVSTTTGALIPTTMRWKVVVKKPAEAMGALQALARAVAHEGKPLSWTTPTGLPWVNRYHVR